MTDRLRWGLLAGISMASAVVWYVTITGVSWLPSFFRVPHLDTPKLLGISESSLRGFAAMAIVEMLLYSLAWWLARALRTRWEAVAVLLLAIPSVLALALAYPTGAGDVYAYIAESDLVLRHHLNPFFVPVGRVADSPLLPFLDFPNETTHYGPLWLIIAIVLRVLSGGDLLAAILIFKLAAALLLGVTAWLVFATLRTERPSEAVPAALLVAWNPLMLYEFAGNAHNDIAMASFVALAFFCQGKRYQRAAVLSLVAASLVKYVAVVLIPLFLIVDLRRAGHSVRWVPRVILDVVLLGLVGLLLSLVVGTDGTIGILQKMTTWFTTSPGAVLFFYLSRSMPASEASSLVGEVARAAYIASYAVIAGWLWLRPSALRSAALLSVVFLMFIQTVWFQPWYVAWALPIAALVEGSLGCGLALGMTLGGFGVHLVMGFGWRLWWFVDDKVILHGRGAASMWAPTAVVPLIFASASLVRRLMSKSAVSFTSENGVRSTSR